MIAALWALLFVAAQGAVLLLTHAGKSVGYQHLLPVGTMVRDHPAPSAVVLLQVALVAAASARSLPAALRWISVRLAGWRAAIVLVPLVMVAAAPSLEPRRWASEIVVATLLQVVALANVALAVSALPGAAAAAFSRALDRLLGPPGEEVVPAGPDRLAWVLAAAVTVIALVLNFVSYQGVPHIPDEVAHLFQARTYAAWRLALPAPPVPAAFDVDLIEQGRAGWYAVPPPGWPAFLAIGVRLGVPWLINPLLGGACVLLGAVLLRELYPPRTARLALVLLALSPWHVFLAMSFMNHTVSLAFVLIAGIAVARMLKTGSLGWGLIGGLAIGADSVNRPLEGLAVAGYLGLISLAARGKWFRFAPAAALTLGTAITGAISMWYNRALTGSVSKFPLAEYFNTHYGPGINDLGFGANRGLPWRGLDPLPGHGPIDVAINSLLNTCAINVELFGWATASLLPVALLLAARRRLSRTDLVMLGGIVAIVAIHSLYWFSGGPDFGGRYWFLVIVPLVALAARGITALESKGPAHDARPAMAALLLCASALLTFYPWRAADKYYHYRGMQPGVAAIAREHHVGRGLVLIRGLRHPDYAAAVNANPVDLMSDAPVFAWDRSLDVRQQVLQAFPGRQVWFVDGPSVTGDGYRLLAGPLTSEEALLEPLWEQR